MAAHLPLLMRLFILDLCINRTIFQSCTQASSDVHGPALALHCSSQKSGRSVFSELLLLIHVSHTKADIKHWSVMCLSATFQRAHLLGLDGGSIAVTGSKRWTCCRRRRRRPCWGDRTDPNTLPAVPPLDTFLLRPRVFSAASHRVIVKRKSPT